MSRPQRPKIPASSPKRKQQLQKAYREDPELTLRIVNDALRHSFENLCGQYDAPGESERLLLWDCLEGLTSYITNPKHTGIRDLERNNLKCRNGIVKSSLDSGDLAYFSALNIYWAITNLTFSASEVFRPKGKDDFAFIDGLDIALQQAVCAIGCAKLYQEQPKKRIRIINCKEIFNLESKKARSIVQKEIRWQTERIQDAIKALHPDPVPFKPNKRKRLSPLAL